MLSRLKLDPFLPALVGTVLLALAWPQLGVTGGPLRADRAATYGIAIIFFLYGASLETSRLLESAARWKLHLVVQLATFGLFPLVVVIAMPLIGKVFPPEVAIGFFFLAALPSTVSSSVAMTSLARGNVPVAIFNASISSLIGVFVTPLLMASYLHATGGHMALGDVIVKLVTVVMLPLGFGQLVRPLVAGLIARHKAVVKVADRGVILAIVYNAFCDSVAGGVWSGQSPTLVIEMAAGAVWLFAVVFFVVQAICRIARFSEPDTVAVVFCASKKSLATGLPMATVMFGANPQLSLIIMPIMLYHFLQLVIVGFIAGRYGARADALEAIEAAEASEPSLLPEEEPKARERVRRRA